MQTKKLKLLVNIGISHIQIVSNFLFQVLDFFKRMGRQAVGINPCILSERTFLVNIRIFYFFLQSYYLYGLLSTEYVFVTYLYSRRNLVMLHNIIWILPLALISYYSAPGSFWSSHSGLFVIPWVCQAPPWLKDLYLTLLSTYIYTYVSYTLIF